MKFFLVALLFVALGSTMASGYVKLSANTINNSDVIKDLRQLGAEYVIQQGVFVSTKAHLENGNWVVSETQSIYRKIVGAVTYYKYNVIIKSNSDFTEIKATYIVSFRPANGKVLVTYYHYKILGSDSNEFTSDLPQFTDVRNIEANAYLSAKLQEGLDYTIAHAKAAGDIKAGTYHIGRIFSAGDQGYTSPYFVNFLVTLANKSGYTYRARITVPDLEETPEDQWPNYPVTYVIYPNN